MDVKAERNGWSLGRKALACVLALAIAVTVPLPRQDAVAETLSPAASAALEAGDVQPEGADDPSGGDVASAAAGLKALEATVDPDDPAIEGNYISYGYFEDRIGIRWAYEVRKDGTANISGRQNSPDQDGENWIIPEYVTDDEGVSHQVTTMVGSTLGPNNWFFNGGNANSITFPASIKRMRDTWGQSFITSACFSSYANADKRVFFLGPPPEDLNWDADISSSDLRMKIDTPYEEEWTKTLATVGWSKTTFRHYEAPGDYYPMYLDSDGDRHKVLEGDTVKIPKNGGIFFHVVYENASETTAFYKWHSNIRWTSSNPAVSVYNDNGWVWALSGSKPGDEATITMENGLFKTYSFKVEVTPEAEDALYKDANGAEWRFEPNADGAEDEPVATKTATITKLENKPSFTGKDVVVPSRVVDSETGYEYEVTQIGGPNFYGDEEAVLEDMGAKSVTFPGTIRSIADQSTRFFDGMVQSRGKIFFLGDPPAIDWETITSGYRGPNGLVVRSIQEWADAGCPWYGAYAYTMEEYDAPEGLAIVNGGEDVTGKKVALPIGLSLALDAQSTPQDDSYYAGHTTVTWESSEPSVVSVTDEGAVTVGADAAEGKAVTLTARSALGFTAICTVELGAVPVKTDLSGCAVNLGDGFEVYKGASLFMPALEVKHGDVALVEGTDFTRKYVDVNGSEVSEKQIRAGKEYKLVLTGAGHFYEGTKEINFKAVKNRVPVGGWQYTLSGTTITIDKYLGGETGTLVVPAYIGAKRVTGIAAGAFTDKTVDTLVIPDSVEALGNISNASISTVRFMGAAPADLAAGSLPASAKVERFKAHAGDFAAFAGAASPEVPWKYYLKLSMRGEKTGVLGSSAAEPTSACQIPADPAADFKLPSEVDGVELSTIGARAVASDAADNGLLDFSVVRVPGTYTEIAGGAFDHLDAAVVFEGAAPAKVAGDTTAVAVEDWSGKSKPQVLYPQGAAGWGEATDRYDNGWAASIGGAGNAYNPHYEFTFIDDESGVGRDVYLTGYNGSPRNVWMYPHGDSLEQASCMIGSETLGGFKDANIDATRLTQITVPGGIDKIYGCAFQNIDLGRCDEIYFSTLVHQKVPVAGDGSPDAYRAAFQVKEGFDQGDLSITCPAANYQAWKDSEWAKYYNIKIHMVSAPTLFDYENVTVTDSEGEVHEGLAVTGYHGLETSVAVPSFVGGVTRDGVLYRGAVVAIADNAFTKSSISAVNIPGSVVSIGSYAFHNRGVSYVNIEEGVERIGTWCFWGCSALQEIWLPSSLKKVGEAPFGVSGLKAVHVSKADDAAFEDVDGVLYTKGLEKLVYYPLMREGQTYDVPAQTKSIGEFAFRGAANTYVNPYEIEKVVLPDGLEEIEQFAFQQMDELVEVNVPDSVTKIGKYAFQSCNSLRAVNIPSGLTEVPEGMLEFCESVSEVTVPAKVKKIDEDAFFSMGSLRKVSLPEGLEAIDTRAFGGCTALADINLPHTLKSVGSSCFLSDKEIRTLDLGSTSLETTGSGAFAGLTGVKHEIVIPATMKDLGLGTFSGMHNVPKVSFAEGFSMTELGPGVFANMSGLEWITIPAVVEKVGANLFFETAVKRTDPDSQFHVVFLNQEGWECDEDQTMFDHYYDTIQQAYVYGYSNERSTTKKNISDSNGDVFPGIYWRPIDIEVSSEWDGKAYAEPGKAFRLIANAFAAYGALSYTWKVDGEVDPGMTAEVFTHTWDTAGTHSVTVDIANEYDPGNPVTLATSVKVTIAAEAKYPLARAKIDAIPVQVLSGKEVKPKPRVTYEGALLVEGVDYTLNYANNTKVGTGKVYVEGMGRFAGEGSAAPAIVATFAIVGATVDALMDAIASAKVDRLGVVASDDGYGLAAGIWYAPKAKISALDSAIKSATNVALAAKPTKAQIGNAAKALQTAQSAFNAAKSKAAGDEKPGVQGAAVTVKDQVYSGKALTPALAVKRGGTALSAGVDYTARYSNNKNVGLASVTVEGCGAYGGSKTVTFKVNPKGTSLSKLSSGAAKKLTVKWTKQATQTTGYEVLVATNKAFTANTKAVKVTKAATTSATVTGLKAKTTYYAKVRTYKTVGGKTYYSAWSAVKNAKTK